MSSDKVKTLPNGDKVFYCPGCKAFHGVKIGSIAGNGTWIYNNNAKLPTFRPAMLSEQTFICKAYVVEGMIHFAAECTHDLSAKSVTLPDWPIEYNAEIVDP